MKRIFFGLLLLGALCGGGWAYHRHHRFAVAEKALRDSLCAGELNDDIEKSADAVVQMMRADRAANRADRLLPSALTGVGMVRKMLASSFGVYVDDLHDLSESDDEFEKAVFRNTDGLVAQCPERFDSPKAKKIVMNTFMLLGSATAGF